MSGTFTDKDLYEMLQKHFPAIFWAKWERLAPSVQESMMHLANDIWGRLS